MGNTDLGELDEEELLMMAIAMSLEEVEREELSSIKNQGPGEQKRKHLVKVQKQRVASQTELSFELFR